ncbi:MAG: hypothetical protein K8I30_00445 [Anaerolineae bacterium]|nr:hypothetical protein [Anaerolineae bacterium]
MNIPHYEDYAVILNAECDVLLIDGALPAVASSERHFWQTCEPVNRALKRTYGINVTTVRCVHTDKELVNVYLMEYQDDPRSVPPGGAWVAPDKLPRLSAPATKTDIQGWLAWFQSDHPQRRDWYRPGFFHRIQETLPERFADIRIRRLEQVRSWERSSIICILTDDSPDLYLKTIPPMFAYEPALSAWLYQHHPTLFPTVRDYRSGSDLIMAAYSGKALQELPELGLWEAALTRYAALQVEFASRTDELKTLGVPVRGLDWIAAHIDLLLDDDALLRCGTNPLSEEQIMTLRGLRSRLHAACESLSRYNLPPSLEHGDLWTGQIIVRPEGGFLFTDWSDSAITCPLFSLPYFLAEVDDELTGVPDAREQLAVAYLQPWTAFESMPRLLEAYESVRLLSPFYTSLQYAFDILPRMEMCWEMENMLAYNLRLLLRENT